MAFRALTCAVLAACALADPEGQQSLKPDAEAPAAEQNATAAVTQSAQHLRVCNAYTSESGLDMSLVRTGEALGHLKYKDCVDLDMPLQKGDKIDFKAANDATNASELVAGTASLLTTDIGKFSVSEIPDGAGTLLLVVRRVGAMQMNGKFMSHAFSSDDPPNSAQVAVIDASLSDAKAAQRKLQIMDADSNASDAEDLPLNSALAISPGAYKIGVDGKNTTVALDTKANTSYVVLCVGSKRGGGDFAEEIVVFGNTEAVVETTDVKSGAAMTSLSMVAGLVAASLAGSF